jgi:hypothetical protein
MFVCCECCVLSSSGLYDGLITRPEESYRMWRVVVCDQETSKTRRLMPATKLWKIQPQCVVTPGKQTKHVHKKYKILFICIYMCVCVCFVHLLVWIISCLHLSLERTCVEDL